MLTVAYLANQFPSAVEPYISGEISELRDKGVRVIAGSVRKPATMRPPCPMDAEIVLQTASWRVFLKAAVLCLKKCERISDLFWRVACLGQEGPLQRVKAFVHAWLGACYAVLLQDHRVDHIHVHHGYFGSWIAMVAARLLDVDFSITLHGSDLLVHGTYLDVKLANCRFCLTVSGFNRRYILEHYPQVDAQKIVVSRLGVEVDRPGPRDRRKDQSSTFTLVSVGRLHPVKNQALLVQACAELHKEGVKFECLIAGEGPERRKLESLIRTLDLGSRVKLLGHVPHDQLPDIYDRADVVVLTSHSEGIPLVLMEAMARGKIVLAPAITGIPELVIDGRTGFLYPPGSLRELVDWLLMVHLLRSRSAAEHSSLSSAAQLDWIRHGAFIHVLHNFNRKKNLERFSAAFLERIAVSAERVPHANLVLQQVQLSVQRH